MPTRTLLRLFLVLAGLATPWCAFALGAGQLEVRSALNQILEAQLPLTTSNPAELTGLVARIPRQEEFDRAGVERLDFLSKLRFSVQTPPGGPNVVKITSLEPIREPNFTLLVELVWPRGRMIREFTIQLDPELYANRQPPPPPPVVAPPPVAAPSAAPPAAPPPVTPQLPPAPPVSFEGASFYGPVKAGETLAAIANRVRPSTKISVPQMMAILIAGNPTAFNNGNPNTLRSGATLKVPTPQALGAPTDATSVPKLATTMPAAPEPAATIAPVPATPTPVDLTPPSTPTPLPAAAPASMPAAVEPSPPPPPIATTPLSTTPVTEVTPPAAPTPTSLPLSSAEQPREIVPQATIPQPEPATPPAATPPAAAPTAAPPAATPPAAAPTTTPQPATASTETEPSWMSNPVVWVAIALIVLAIAALILLPLLRRPVQKKPAEAASIAPESPEGESTAVVEPRSTRSTQTQARDLGSVRPRPAAGAAAAPVVPGRVEAAPGSSAPAPKPIGELLKDLDFRLGEGPPPSVAGQGAAPARDIKAPLLEVEPPTASVTRRPVNPFAETPAEPAKPEKAQKPAGESSIAPPMEPLSGLQLDGLDFDLGDLGFDQPSRPQPSELPPLEMKPGTAGATKKPSELPSLKLSITEPATEPPSLASTRAVPADSPTPGLKFEFTDVTQEIAGHGAPEDLGLDEALQTLGGDALKLSSGQPQGRGPDKEGMDTAEFVETKLDLASAYLDMGDQIGARSLLEEVLREGNATQKGRAGELLKKLG